MKSSYRPDVDGLRAVAILSVLGYHARGLPGGFVGVDIFFVISGFLISGILFDAQDSGVFTFADFYARRIRRIFPALCLVCTACLLFGWFALLPNEYRQFGKHVLGGAGFSSNLILYNEAGYFDGKASLKPLLHLWSLGVEEQFYLLWPLLLFWCRGRARPLSILLVGAAGVSFALNLYLTRTDPSAAFYLPMTRFWELMCGSVLAYWPRYGRKALPASRFADGILGAVRRVSARPDVTATVGSIALALSLVLINDQRAFPGFWALLVCGGAALVIGAGPNAWINRKFLASGPMVWVGLISYPLYLWHWPVLCFENITLRSPVPAPYRVGAVLVSFVLAWLTYRCIELPVRRQARSAVGARQMVTGLVVAMASIGALGGFAWWSLIPSASAGNGRLVEISEAMTDWEAPPDDDVIVRGSVDDTVLFIGDSHMMQFWPRLRYLVDSVNLPRRSIEVRTLAGCPPILGVERIAHRCLPFIEKSYERAAQGDVSTVVISGSWSGFVDWGDYYRADGASGRLLKVTAPENQWIFDGFEQTLAQLRRRGKRVIVVLSTPHGDDFGPDSMVDRSHLPPRPKPFRPVSRQYLDKNNALGDDPVARAAREAGAEVLEPSDWFCIDANCPMVDASGRPLMMDPSHIRASVARTRIDAFDQYVLLPSVGNAQAHPPGAAASAFAGH